MVTKKNDFIVKFFIIFGIFALNACATVRYESRPTLEPLPVTEPVPITEAEVEPIAEAETEPAPPVFPVSIPVAEEEA